MQFKDLVEYMVNTYGVRSYLDNEDDIEEGSYWFECPECGEPILEDDYSAEEIMETGCCPVCEESIYGA